MTATTPTPLHHRRWPWALLLLAVALAYYGSYWRHTLNFRDEGGTVTLVAQRLLAGEVPIREVTLSYNVGWFAPICWLFERTGVSFVALRAYCFALSTLAALIGFFTLCRCGVRPWAAWLAALLAVAVPGMTFKNYLPLLVIANCACLVRLVLAGANTRRVLEIGALSGVVLLGTFLIRIDIGFLFALGWLGTLAARVVAPGPRALLARQSGMVAVFLFSAVWLGHQPVLRWARGRGFEREFVQQYRASLQLLHLRPLDKLITLPPATHLGKVGAQPNIADKVKAVAAAPDASFLTKPVIASAASGDPLMKNLRLPSWSAADQIADAEKRTDLRLFVVLAWLPVFVIGTLAALGLWRAARAIVARDEAAFFQSLAALVLLGGCLTNFPQFFLFRPDAPHLSEFSPGFWFAVIGALALIGVRLNRAGVICLSALGLHTALFLYRMVPDRWCGTIAARFNRSTEFRGENGTRVVLSKKEAEGLKQLVALIQSRAQPGEFVPVYPYHPAVNVVVNRPTYERNVYVDDAIAGPRWNDEAIARFEKFRPAAVVVSDWDINGTDASRFRHWAAPAKAWLEANYDRAGAVKVGSDEFEVFARKEGR